MTCFVSAPFGVDTSTLVQEIKKRGFTPVDGRSIKTEAAIAVAIRDAMAKARFCIAVLQAPVRPNTYLEIGLALGLAKRCAVFVDRGTTLPSDLANASYSRADLEDRVAVGKFLDAFFQFAKQRPPKVSPQRSQRHQLEDADYIALLLDAESAGGLALERAAFEALSKAGYVVGAPFSHEQRAADFAVWFDELYSTLGGPVLVEVKGGHVDATRDLLNIEKQLRAALVDRGSQLGILIHQEGGAGVSPSASVHRPMVIKMSMSWMLNALHRGVFDAELVRFRNALVHGDWVR